MATTYISFIECTSVNISYDKMGLATVTWTVVHNINAVVTNVAGSISFGDKTFSGYVTSASTNAIPDADGWYETNVNFISTC